MNNYLISGKLILLFSITAIFIQCSSKKETFVKEDTLQFSDSLLHRMMIDTVESATNSNQLVLTGKITPDEDKMARIFPMVSGIISNIQLYFFQLYQYRTA